MCIHDRNFNHELFLQDNAKIRSVKIISSGGTTSSIFIALQLVDHFDAVTEAYVFLLIFVYIVLMIEETASGSKL